MTWAAYVIVAAATCGAVACTRRIRTTTRPGPDLDHQRAVDALRAEWADTYPED